MHRPPTKQAQEEKNLSSKDHPVTSGIQVHTSNKCHPTGKKLILHKPIQVEIDVPSVGIPDKWKVSSVLPRTFQCKTCHKFTRLCYKKKVSFMSRTPKAHQLQAAQVYMQEDSICSQSGDLTSSNGSFCLQVRIHCALAISKIPITYHHITKLAYKLKTHHKRNHYLRARLDT